MTEALLFQIKPSRSLGCSFSKSHTEKYPIYQPGKLLSKSSSRTMRYTGIMLANQSLHWNFRFSIDRLGLICAMGLYLCYISFFGVSM